MSNAVTCGTCALSHLAKTPQDLRGNLECRESSPQLVAITIKTQQGGALVPAAMFPVVRPEWFCSKGVMRPVAPAGTNNPQGLG